MEPIATAFTGAVRHGVPVNVDPHSQTVTSIWELDEVDRAMVAEGAHVALLQRDGAGAVAIAHPECAACRLPMKWDIPLRTFVCDCGERRVL